MERICRISRLLRIVFLAAIIMIPLTQAAVWFNLGRLDSVGFDSLSHFIVSADLNPQGPVTSSTRTLGFLVSMLPAAINMLAFYCLYRLFGLYARAAIFTAPAVGYIRKAGWALLAAQAVGPLYDALLSFVLSMHNPVGQRTISIGFSSTDLSAIIVAVLVIMVSWVMDEGRKLKEEEALVI